MSTINGKLITPFSDEAERLDSVEKKVNTMISPLREVIEHTNQTTVRLQKVETTLEKVSDLEKKAIALDYRIKTTELKQKKSVVKVLIGTNFIVSIVMVGLLALNWRQIQPEIQNDSHTLFQSLRGYLKNQNKGDRFEEIRKTPARLNL